ncbi:hypothetical protein [Streptomyces albidocamelliae]|uniref:Uncharacterized protein n=1 Tax=Streptomyces albidocamelliae TaxID=2981135 RepID=A0ABY6EXZ4_9ACTN|nr:hypothetical protein [Streptomyces sp. HUAS 14-6]UXY39275.1 hypothetical protein N8I86_33925 [Streptomyces sp. HUAS 14-6]
MQGLLDLALDALTHRMPGLPGQPTGLPGQRADHLALPACEPAQPGAVQFTVGAAQLLAEGEQRRDLVRLPAHQEVADPGGQARPAQCADLRGEALLAGPPGVQGATVTGRDELLRPQCVQLVGDGVQVHRRPSRRPLR